MEYLVIMALAVALGTFIFVLGKNIGFEKGMDTARDIATDSYSRAETAKRILDMLRKEVEIPMEKYKKLRIKIEEEL